MKKILVILFSIATGISTVAQATPDTTDNYRTRFTGLNKAYVNKPDNVEALFNLSLFYFDNSHPMRNLPMAMKYIQRAEARHIAMLQNDDYRDLAKLSRKNITIQTIRTTRQAIRDAALNTIQLKKDMSNAEIDSYLDAFGNDGELVRLLRQRRIALIYNEDLQLGTPDACYHFIKQYPGTNEAELMEEHMATMAPKLFDGIATEEQIDAIAEQFTKSPAVQRAALKQKSRIAYTHANRNNTIEAYNNFLKHYPSSDENLQAREDLATLLEVRYASLSTPKEFADFIDSNADDALADNALTELRRMINKEHNVEAARIYLSRFKYDSHYNEVYNTYYQWYAEEGNGKLIRRFEEENPDFPFPRAIEVDLERADKTDTVNLMENVFPNEVTKYADLVRRMMGKKIAIVPLQRMIQPLMTARRYKEATDWLKSLSLCFESCSDTEYNELLSIISAPATGHRLTTEYAASYHVENPCINPADGMLYFTHSTGADNRIRYAVKEAGKWVIAGNVEFTNTENDGLRIFGFYADGRRMLIGKDGDIWVAEQDGEQWRISDIPPYPVNTDYTETDAFMLADGSGMLLASDRPNGINVQHSGDYYHGDTALASDIYFIPYTQMGWGDAINLGIKINTPYSERSPIMSGNLKTLYFISDGRGGLGYGDIYIATRDNIEDWTSWGNIRNAGKEINTCFRESSISFADDEKRILLSSNHQNDIYRCYSFATWHKTDNRYEQMTLDIMGMENYLNRVRVADLTLQTVAQQINYSSDRQTVKLNIHKDKRYAIFGDAGSFFVPAIVIEPKDNTKNIKQQLKGYTFPVLVSIDKPLPLPAVEFTPQSDKLQSIAQLQLEQLAQFIKHNPTCIIEVVVDVAGRNDTKCYNLSLERGRAIRNFMVNNGIDIKRITISAYGNVNTKKGTKPAVAIRFRERL